MDDYRKCKVDPSAPDFVDRFKQLHPDFEEELILKEVTEKSLFTYIVLTYDVNSPFVIKYNDWSFRRRETAKAAGFRIAAGKYIKEAENIIVGRMAVTNRMAVRYCFLQNDPDFIKLQSYQALLRNQIVESFNTSNIKATEAAKLKNNIDVLTKETKVLQKSIFSGNETKDMLKTLYAFIDNISYDFRPEDIATKKEEGEPVVDEFPYGKKYKPEKLKFLDDQ